MNPLLINLARRRFANQRPLLRAAALLWTLALVGIGANAWLYREYYQGSGERGRRLAEIETRLKAEAEGMTGDRNRLAALDLEQQSAVVTFLNEKIDQRTFSWSRLFDHLSAVLPGDVRLTSLAPSQPDGEGRKASRAGAGGRGDAVLLVIEGVAKTDEALAEFLDRLFAHPSFKGANLAREARQESDFLSFNLSVEYLPRAAGADVATTSLAASSPAAEEEEER